MSALIIILTAALVVAGVFGDTFNKEKRKITTNGIVVLVLALVLGVVQFIKQNDDDALVSQRDKTIELMSVSLKNANAQLLTAQQRAERYHQELVAFTLSPMMPSPIVVTIDTSKNLLDLSLFYIVIRSAAGWEMWLSTTQTRLCASSRKTSVETNSVYNKFITAKTDFSDCLKYRQDIMDFTFYRREGDNDMSKSGRCINCPMGSMPLPEEYDIIRHSKVHRPDDKPWPGQDFYDGPAESLTTLYDGFSYFTFEAVWRVEPSTLEIDADSDFDFRTLLDTSRQLDVFLVPKEGGLEASNKNFVEIMEQYGVEDTCYYVIEPEELEGPCTEFYGSNPSLMLMSTLDFSGFTASLTMEDKTYRLTNSEPHATYVGCCTKAFFEYILLGEIDLDTAPL